NWPKVLPMRAAKLSENTKIGRARPPGAPPGWASRPYHLDRFKGALEVLHQIAQIFDANREPDERIADADRFALFFWHRRMRHESWMIDQAFDAAEAFGQRKEVRVFQKTPRAREIGFQNYGHDSAKAAHLRAGEIVLGMRL